MSHVVRRSGIALLVLGIAAAWLGIIECTLSPRPNLRGGALLVAALLIFGYAIRAVPARHADISAALLPEPLAHRGRQRSRSAYLLLLMAAILGCATVIVAPRPAWQPWPVLSAWLATIGCFLIGVARLDQQRRTSGSDAPGTSKDVKSRAELIALAAITLAALKLRGAALGNVPHNIHGDEGEMGLVARAILGGQHLDPFSTTWMTHPTLWFYLQAAALQLFGNDIAGLRMLSALLGTAAIPALYLLARPQYGRTIALAAAALLATFHMHIHYSRLALNNIVDPLLCTLVFAAFLHGYRTRRALGFAVAGTLMGLANYVYFGSRLIPVLMLELLTLLVITRPRELIGRRQQLALMGGAFILTAGPLLRYYMAHPDTFGGRMAEYGILNKLDQIATGDQPLRTVLANHAYDAIGLLLYRADTTPFYSTLQPLLNPASAVLALIGIALLVAHRGEKLALLLLLWVLNTAIFGGFLLVGLPQSTRYVIAAPALCLLVVLGAGALAARMGDRDRTLGAVLRGGVAIALALIMAWNVFFYFAQYTALNRYGRSEGVTATAYAVKAAGPSHFAYMLTAPAYFLNHGTIAFVANSPRGVDIKEPLHSATHLPELPPDTRPIFVITPERLAELPIIQVRYPDGTLQTILSRSQPEQPLIYVYEPH